MMLSKRGRHLGNPINFPVGGVGEVLIQGFVTCPKATTTSRGEKQARVASVLFVDDHRHQKMVRQSRRSDVIDWYTQR
jgi:hypothetical protein